MIQSTFDLNPWCLKSLKDMADDDFVRWEGITPFTGREALSIVCKSSPDMPGKSHAQQG